MSSLQIKFPVLIPGMTLQQEVQTVNDIRLGMFTKELSQTELNTNLDELLPSLTEAEMNMFMQNLSSAYAKVKIWCETKRKLKITIEVSEKQAKLQDKANKQRTKKAKVKSIDSLETADKALVYDSDPAINKAIKEMVKFTGSKESAVAMLKSIGGLPEGYELN